MGYIEMGDFIYCETDMKCARLLHFTLLHDLARPHNQRVMWLYGQEPMNISYHSAKFGDHRRSGGGNIMILLFPVILMWWCYPLRKKCPYSELFCSVFSRIRTKYREIRSISPYSVWMPENKDQYNSKYGQFLGRDHLLD